jgi:hypothetical protein
MPVLLLSSTDQNTPWVTVSIRVVEIIRHSHSSETEMAFPCVSFLSFFRELEVVTVAVRTRTDRMSRMSSGVVNDRTEIGLDRRLDFRGREAYIF